MQGWLSLETNSAHSSYFADFPTLPRFNSQVSSASENIPQHGWSDADDELILALNSVLAKNKRQKSVESHNLVTADQVSPAYTACYPNMEGFKG